MSCIYTTGYSICLWDLRTKQDWSDSKEGTCFLDAIETILTTKQLQKKTRLQQACLKWRHQIGTTKDLNINEIYKKTATASKDFVETLGRNLQEEVDKMKTKKAWCLNPDMDSSLDCSKLEDLLYISSYKRAALQQEPDMPISQIDYELTSRKEKSEINAAAHNVMATEYHLQEVLYEKIFTLNALIGTLRSEGPLVVNGFFGMPFYLEKATYRFTVEEYHFYGWPKNTPFGENFSCTHSIVIVGAGIINSLDLVFWHNSNAEDFNAKKVLYVSRFSTFVKRLLCSLPNQMPIGNDGLFPNKDPIPVGYCNPSLLQTNLATFVELISV